MITSLKPDFASSPEKFSDFLSYLPGDLALKTGRDFCFFLLLSPFPDKQSTKKPGKFSGKEIRDENSKISGNFRSAAFLT